MGCPRLRRSRNQRGGARKVGRRGRELHRDQHQRQCRAGGGPWRPVYSGTAGVSVGDSAGARAYIAGNWVRGYNLGVFVRESRTGRITGNTVTGNCVGVLVFDDSATEIPDTTRHVVGDDWKVAGNTSVANNRYCIAGRDQSQRVSGVGMLVTNADHVLVTGNTIRGNHPVIPAGGNPLTSPAGGLIPLSLASPPGTNPPGAVDPGLVEYVRVVGNTIRNNLPVDIWLTRPIPGTPVRAPGPGDRLPGQQLRDQRPRNHLRVLTRFRWCALSNRAGRTAAAELGFPRGSWGFCHAAVTASGRPRSVKTVLKDGWTRS